ncbi:MAG: glycoside hydrolase/phage tail family protein [Aestuariivirga sp.]|uniref:baseplate multidomain protein megatron n=1 Tax=Aestuariivirga sp. TaxID=2650926 RepID=UPI0025B9354F|nr:glycoside hydrolase/phage tail family protein [Aestuariivirga sp.]MCA3561487.1 glycoside hydrolase/phage tail family protein [Aestuariivirga sp.]
MATVVLQAVGTGLGTLLGGPVGGMIGRALGAVAGSFIDEKLFGGARTAKGPRLTDLRVMASTEGAPIARLWGRMRVAGQVIWATDFIEKTKTEGGKGGGGGSGGKVKTYSYSASFAVALCEGEIDRIGRVWADGRPFDLRGVTARIYTGSETQEADSLIAAIEGQGKAPAYRGLAYVVFEQLPLAGFGNRLPQLSFEVMKGVGGMESHVKAVNIIPGSTEFGYDTEIVTRQAEEGVTAAENAHASAVDSDFSVSLDQLKATCRKAAAASLVVAWFGNDLRCGNCRVQPGVETAGKQTSPSAWSVSGVARGAAYVVSRRDGEPAFGGTPSDASVLRAIAELKARRLKVMFHPFVLMDIAPGNALPDPYGGAEQAAYPWRGRITGAAAPGRAGSPDKTPAAAAEIAAFVGQAQPQHFTAAGASVTYSGPPEWSFRRMILHYAKLCALAGGVDAFLIGSELTGLTTLRREANGFPFVAALMQLAQEVKAILPLAQVSYGADWSEWSGHQPADGTGDVFFHLDPFWSLPQVGFIGLDNYLPLADWRDGESHRDRLAGWTSVYDTRYLMANIAGGEYFDWYYASAADRALQLRTPIGDGAYAKPWVFRRKDLKGWWTNRHYNRPGGVESATPTGWTPQSKPIWFTEAGCAAVDKGSNEPNAFIDAKSAESRLPPFSSGARDDLMQARHVTALDEYWSDPANNPASAVDGQRMVNAARIFLWAWDARPFPQFPARDDLWADALNYERGHWLNGRAGIVPLGGLVAEVMRSYGLDDVDVSAVEGMVAGFAIDRVMPGRDALEGLMRAMGLDAVESGGGLRVFMRKSAAVTALTPGGLAEANAEAPLYRITRAQETDLPAAVKLSYLEAGLDYRLAVAEAKQTGGAARRDGLIELPAAVTQAEAQKRAQVLLQEAWAGRETVELALPPSQLALEPGDVLALSLDDGSYLLRIEEMAEGNLRKIRGRSFDRAVQEPADAPGRGQSAETAVIYGPPAVQAMDLALADDSVQAHAPWIAAAATPWPGELSLYRRTGKASLSFNRAIGAAASMGVLLTPLAAGPLGCLDRGPGATVRLSSGAVFPAGLDELLQGANLAAVGSMATGWEIVQFAGAELVGVQSWRLSLLLRGQFGSEPEMRALRPAGERFVLLDQAVVQPVLSLAQAGLEQSWQVGPSEGDFAQAQASVTLRSALLGLRPLAPVRLKAARQGADVRVSWIRRSRIGGDSWEASEIPLAEEREAYRIDVLAGAAVRRSVAVGESQWLYRAADIAADFGPGTNSFTLRVAQLSSSFGAGAAVQETLYV